MKKFYNTLVIISLLATIQVQAQTWTVGQPVMTVFTSVGGYAGGCYPNADFTFPFPGSNVSGVSYYLVVTNTPASSVLIQPMNDTLAVGDTILMPIGSSPYSVYCFTGAGGPVQFKIIAKGTPTTAGQPYPCSVSQLWLSNLMLCPEGLINNVSNNCSVQASTGISEPSSNEIQIDLPGAANAGNLTVSGQMAVTTITDVTGKLIYQSNKTTLTVFDMSTFPIGVYTLQVAAESRSISRKFVLQ